MKQRPFCVNLYWNKSLKQLRLSLTGLIFRDGAFTVRQLAQINPGRLDW